jgi:hypothetical protein
MAATTIGTTGTIFGIPNAEVGVIISTIDRASQRQKKEIMGNVGDIAAVGYYAPKAVYSIAGALLFPNGFASGLSGLALSAYPGGVVSLANVQNDTSTTGGHVYCEEFTTREVNDDFVKFTGTLTQYPSITSP